MLPRAERCRARGDGAAFDELHRMVVALRPHAERLEFERRFGIRGFDVLASDVARDLDQAAPAGGTVDHRYARLEDGLNLILQSTGVAAPPLAHWPNRFDECDTLPF